MKKIKQSIIGEKGNCLQACVASILDLNLDDVPHFILYKDNWFNAVILFMQDYGYEYEGISSSWDYYKDEYVIGVGMSPRGRSHATIYRNGELIHDPHPEDGGIIFDYYYMFKKNEKIQPT